jgi:thymidine kinase
MAENPTDQQAGAEIPDEIEAWVAICGDCGNEHLTMLTRSADDHGPWKEIISGVTEVDEEDYYCRECKNFVNLKEADVWRPATETQ